MAAVYKYGIPLVEHALYSPDLATLTTTLKKEFGGHHFNKDDDVMNVVDHFPKAQNDALYTEGIRLLHGRWIKRVNIGRDYVDKWLHLIFLNWLLLP